MPAQMHGQSRDIRTDEDGTDIQLLAHATIDAVLSPNRNLLALESDIAGASLQALAGTNAVAKFRVRLRDIFPAADDRESGHYLLLDDIPGAVFVSNWAWLCWGMAGSGGGAAIEDLAVDPTIPMTGVCIGLAAGSEALDASGLPNLAQQSSAIVPDIVHPDDPSGWHAALPAPGHAASRRCRWLDLGRVDGGILVSTGFQDSAIQPDGLRRAVHEYRAEVRINDDGTIRDLTATPRVLPYATCPAAVTNIGALAGLHVSTLREAVPAMLAGEAGCTHLNDVLRALTSIPSLTRFLPARPGENGSIASKSGVEL